MGIMKCIFISYVNVFNVDLCYFFIISGILGVFIEDVILSDIYIYY